MVIAGHPERRFEYWDGRAVCLCAFGSEAEARHRLQRFATEACRWMQLPESADAIESDFDAGIFHFHRQGPLVHLFVDVDPTVHRRLLHLWNVEGQWDEEVPWDPGQELASPDG